MPEPANEELAARLDMAAAGQLTPAEIDRLVADMENILQHRGYAMSDELRNAFERAITKLREEVAAFELGVILDAIRRGRLS